LYICSNICFTTEQTTSTKGRLQLNGPLKAKFLISVWQATVGIYLEAGLMHDVWWENVSTLNSAQTVFVWISCSN